MHCLFQCPRRVICHFVIRNWRGISLLEVVGKVFAKIIQRRLQVLVEDVVADSQCGFRSGRGCADMVFCARQLVEKAIEHNTKVFLLFVDLRKAYDLVPRSAMWLILQKYGVPTVIVDLVRDFMKLWKLRSLWLVNLHRSRCPMVSMV